MSEIIGIIDPVVALRVDLAAMIRWREVEAQREKARREYRAREIEVTGLLFLVAKNGGEKWPDVRELLGLTEDEARGFRDEAGGMVEIIVNGEPRLVPYPPPGHIYDRDGRLVSFADRIKKRETPMSPGEVMQSEAGAIRSFVSDGVVDIAAG